MDEELNEGIYVELTDDEGNKFTLEICGDVEYQEDTFRVFLPADMDETDPDFGFIILKVVDDNGEESYDSIDDDELLEKVYAIYMEEAFADEDEDED